MSGDVEKAVEGRLIDGRYRLRELIGAGGMGEVWRATDERLRRPVAVKLISSRVAAQDATLLRRFRREAEVTARLSHPNIVTVHDVGDDPLYVVMELVQGIGLHRLLPGFASHTADQLISWAVQVCDALTAAHAEGIVHRDLKPSNLILARHTTIKVVDFGIAAIVRPPPGRGHVTPITPDGAVIGTPGYMPPEQIQDGPISPGTDLYALGCVLYALATGGPPFGTSPYKKVFDRHLAEAPTPVRQSRPGFSAGLDRLILDLLEKDPRQRPFDAPDVRRRLNALATAGPGTVQPVIPGPSGLQPTGPLSSAGMPRPEKVESPEERAALLHYLTTAPVAVPSNIRETDRIDPARGLVVPTSVRTDGVWVWSDRLSYYLKHYGYAPEPDFRRHIAAQAGSVPRVEAHLLVAASRLFEYQPKPRRNATREEGT